MANTMYTNAKELFLTSGIDWLNDTIKATLVNVSYIPDFNAHKYLSDVSGLVPGLQHRRELAGKSVVGGAADADNLTFNFVGSGQNIYYVLLYKDTGDTTTSPLIMLIDTASGLPVISTGANIYITFDSGPNKIFSI
jgi:hypothetical protein